MFKKQYFSITVLIGLFLLMIACDLGVNNSSSTNKPIKSTPADLQPTLPPGVPTRNIPTFTGTGTFQAPTPTTRPETKDLIVSKKLWMGVSTDNPTILNTAVEINNPDPDYQLENILIKITALDSAGSELGMAAIPIIQMMPGENHYVGYPIYIPKESIPNSLQVEILDPGRPTLTKSTQNPFTAGKVFFQEDAVKPSVSGVITSTDNKDVYYTRYTAVAFDDTNAVIGSGSVFGDILPANSSIGVKIPIAVSAKPARVELYVNGDVNTQRIPQTPVKVQVEDAAIIRNPGANYGNVALVLTNPDTAQSVVKTGFVATAYDDAGKVMDACSGTIYGVIFPGARLPAGCSLYQIPVDASNLRLDVVTLVDTNDEIPPEVKQNPLSIEQVTFEDSKANAVIKSSWASELAHVFAMVVVYDINGAIIGYGEYPEITVPANGEFPVEIWYSNVQGKPAKVEFFAVPSEFSFLN
jgi:hypothetical protein